MKRYIPVIFVFLILLISSCKDEVGVSTNKESWFSGFTSQMALMAIFFSLISLIIILGLFLNSEKLYKRLMPKVLESQRLRDLINQNNNKQSKERSGSSAITSRDIQHLYGRIDQLEGDIKKQNELIYEIINSRNIPKTDSSNEPNIVSAKEPNKEVIYLPNPNQEGSFNESSALPTYKEGASVYKLTKDSPTIAKFELDNRESAIRPALQYPDKIIDPVCEAENAYNPKAVRITTAQPGIVELRNGKWQVIKKAKIKYE